MRTRSPGAPPSLMHRTLASSTAAAALIASVAALIIGVTTAQAATITEIPVQRIGDLEGPNRLAFTPDGTAWSTFGTVDFNSTRLLRLDPRTGRVLDTVDGLPGIPVDLAVGTDGLLYATSKNPPWGAVEKGSNITAFRADGSVAGTLASRRLLSAVSPAPGGGAWVGSYEIYVTGFTSGDQNLSRWAPGRPTLADVVRLPAPKPGHSTGADRVQLTPDGTTWFLEHNYPSNRPVSPAGTLVGDQRLGRIDPAGSVTLRTLVQDAFVDDFAVARDGSVWFVIRRLTAPGEDVQTLARYAPAIGELQEQPMPVNGYFPRFASLPDGDVWMAIGSAVVRIDPTTSKPTVLPLPTGSLGTSPIAGDIVTRPDGTLWITDANGALIRVDPDDDGTTVGALATAARAGVNALVRCRRACRATATVSAALPNARRSSAGARRTRGVVLGKRRLRLSKPGTRVTRVKTERRALLRGRRRLDITVTVRTREEGRIRTRRTSILLRR